MKPCIILISVWVFTLSLYAAPSSTKVENALNPQEIVFALTQQANKIRLELHDAEERLLGDGGESRMDRKEWIQAYSKRIVILKGKYLDLVAIGGTPQEDADEVARLETVIDQLQSRRVEFLRQEQHYNKLERDVKRLQRLYDLVLNRFAGMDFPGAVQE